MLLHLKNAITFFLQFAPATKIVDGKANKAE
jgi:hypothetical protein